MALDQSIYQVLVHDSTGHNPDQWMTLGAFNTLMSDEEDARLKILEASLFDTVVAKLSDAGKPRTTQVAASAILTASGTVKAEKTVTVNDVTYTFVTDLTTDPDTVPNEVLIGADEDASLTNLTAAINGTAGEGTEYSTGTKQPRDVTGVFDHVSAAKITCTATTAGIGGNAYPKATNETNLDWDGTTGFFTGGEDITAAIAGTIRYEADKIWVATDKCTATESNWHYAELT